MKFENPLIEGVLLKRYKRFLADVKLPDIGTVVAHVPNSGSMAGVSDPGSPCRVSISSNPARKLAHTLEMVKTVEGPWVGVNTSLTNKLVHEAFTTKKIPAWSRFDEIKSEVKISPETRLDFLLTSKKKKRYVEVKNVSMARPPCAVFPDAVTERGQKHLKELLKLAKKGFESELLFVVQREDCHVFKPCDDIDPEYGKILRKVADHVMIQCWTCTVGPHGIELDRQIEVDLS